MSYRTTDLPWLLKYRPEILRDRFLAAFMEHRGNLPATWRALGLTQFTWYAYVAKLGIREQIVSLREAFGVHSRGRHFGYSDEETKPKAAPAIERVGPPADPEDSGVWRVS